MQSSVEVAEPALDFSRRAHLSEWMDEPCSYEEFRACLRDLAAVNRVTFAYRPTHLWMNRLLRTLGDRSAPLHIVDVGCGQGDMLRSLARWALRHSVPVRLTGIDLNPYSARAAAARYQASWPSQVPIEWLTQDALAYTPVDTIDDVISSLFTHHLSESGIVRFLTWMERSARVGWFINDLHRQAAPYHLFRLLSRVMRWHRFVQHDGPVSIRRSFRREDWLSYLDQAEIPAAAVSIEEFRPGRLCVGRLRA